jgi:predicted nucleic acid-binding protein
VELTPHSDRTAVELAVLDAPVLGRGVLTLFLLHLADAGAFDPVWSDQIHADWTREVQRLRPGLTTDRIRQRRLELERAFPVANVMASRDAQDEVLAHCTTPVERKSAHVLATALSARAAVIVTDDSFCLTKVMSRLWHDTAVLSPDAWCLELLDRQPRAVLAGARAHRASISLSKTAADPNGDMGGVIDAAGRATSAPGVGTSAETIAGKNNASMQAVDAWLALLREPHVGLSMTAEHLARRRDEL